MNIPEIYLIEPYNAYAPKGKKKHWHEIVEEQALMARIIAEQMALQEAQSKTLPPNTPDTSTPTVGGTPQGGAGGMPVWTFFNPGADVVGFTWSPTTGAAPLTVQFTNTTTTPGEDQYTWYFGDGTTSTEVSPSHVYQSGSSAAFRYTISLQTTNSLTGLPGTWSVQYLSASKPTTTALFTYVTTSGVGPATASFTNASSTTSQTAPTLTYLWLFGDGTTSSLASPAAHPYGNTGSFTASLQATGSYGIASLYTRSFYVPAPTLTAAFTYITSSQGSGITSSNTNTTTYNGKGARNYVWVFGDGTQFATTLSSAVTHSYSNSGSFTASLQVTESSYGITSTVSNQFFIAQPTVTAAFTFLTSSNSVPSSASFISTTTATGNAGQILTYRWEYGTGSLFTNSVTAIVVNYLNAGPYTASLQVTESLFGVTSRTAQSWYLA